MAAIVFAAPFTPPPPPKVWFGLGMTWTGEDGVVWDLTSGEGGVVMMPGVRGLSMPPITHHKSVYASVPGSRWRGYSVQDREVFWPIQVFHDLSSEAWIERDRAFWKTLAPNKTGLWTVIQPNGQERTLRLRLKEDGDPVYSHDPALAGWSNYGLTFEAEQPFWQGGGGVVSKTFMPENDSDFFNGAAKASPFKISRSATVTSAIMNNPGDVEAYPVWTIEGPCTNATVGVGGVNITIPFAVATGQRLVINTAPSSQQALLAGVDRTADLGTVNFAPIPSGSNVILSLAITGTGSITCAITPRYFRAW